MNVLSRFSFVSVLAVILAACSSSGGSRDNAPPVITLAGDNPQVLVFGHLYMELGATATDNRDGDLTSSIVIDASGVDTSMPGDYTVTYNVTDAAGNVAMTVTRTVAVYPPVPEQAAVTVEGDIKQLIFSWDEVQYTDYYRLMENPDGHSGFTQMGDDISAGTLTATQDIAVHLFGWVEAQYMIEACNVTGCSSSDIVTVTDVMLGTIGYLKASNSDPGDYFGGSVSLSADGRTLAIGACWEKSVAGGVDVDQQDNSATEAIGAVYVTRFSSGEWSQQAYIKPSVPDTGWTTRDQLNDEWRECFGGSVSLSADGNSLGVGAPWETTDSTGINGPKSTQERGSGAAYVFRYNGDSWYQQAYIKTYSYREAYFGSKVEISSDGNTLAVGANRFIGVFVFRFDGATWFEQAKLIPPDKKVHQHCELTYFEECAVDGFGWSISLSSDGNVLAVGAEFDDSNATGINGDPFDNSVLNSGAAYLFRFDGTDWQQLAYFKTPELVDLGEGGELRYGSIVALSADSKTLAVVEKSTDSIYVYRFDGADWYHQADIRTANDCDDYSSWVHSMELSADGDTLVVGVPDNDCNAIGMAVEQLGDSSVNSGAVYVFQYDAGAWTKRSFVKASNTGSGDGFGGSVSTSSDGRVLAVGAGREDSSATGINGNQDDNSAEDAGAVYIY